MFEEEKAETDAGAVGSAVMDLPKQVIWCGLDDGPDGTVGKILARSKDERHSGTLDLFELPSGAQEGSLAFATIPDNITTSFPDNIPDSWLVKPVDDVIGVRPFKLYKLAFGRGFAANYDDDPGLLRWTKITRWGTFLRHDFMYPDPRGAEITGLHPVEGGLLVFTESSTFLVAVSNDGQGFKSQTLHTSVGCSAPSSIKTTPRGPLASSLRTSTARSGPSTALACSRPWLRWTPAPSVTAAGSPRTGPSTTTCVGSTTARAGVGGTIFKRRLSVSPTTTAATCWWLVGPHRRGAHLVA